MYTIDQLSGYVNRQIALIDYPESPAGLYAPIKYTLEGNGKRLRPVLLLATALALGCDIDTPISQALGIEMFHNFTLLHDDVMDNADLRRGRPTVHCRWNVPTAILSGDAMLTIASQLISKPVDGADMKLIRDLFDLTAMQVYEGQQYDMDFEQRSDVTVNEYIGMIRLKTAVLLGCACRMGAIVARADREIQDAFYGYGVNLGLAFQLQDDYLDTYADQAVFGKKIGGDIVNDKKTWLLISALAGDTTGEVASLLGAAIEPHDKISRVKAVYDRLDLPERCHRLIDRYIADATGSIAHAGITEQWKEFFIAIARKSASRNR